MIMKKLWNREALKSFFKKGQLPSELHFEYLIESTVNILDDRFTKSDENGLQLSPVGAAENLISILNDPAAKDPKWQLRLKDDETGAGLSFDSVDRDAAGNVRNTSRFFLGDNGKIGIGTTKPRTQMEIAGTLGVMSRIGSYVIGKAPGDGEWHNVLEQDVDGVQAFEIVARIDGPPKRGKYAMTHAIALSTFGGSNHRIKQVRAHFGWFLNRIEFRWKGTTHKYNLQVRTRSHYGFTESQTNFMIRYHITCLWDDSIFQQL